MAQKKLHPHREKVLEARKKIQRNKKNTSQIFSNNKASSMNKKILQNNKASSMNKKNLINANHKTLRSNNQQTLPKAQSSMSMIFEKESGRKFHFGNVRLNSYQIKKIGNSFFSILLCSIALILIGITMVFSAQTVTALNNGQNLFFNLGKQILILLLSIILGLYFIRIKSHNILFISIIFFIISCILQILVFATPLGISINGNRNWLNLGFITFQPSEFIKLSVILILSIKLSIYDVSNMSWKEIICKVLFWPIFGVGLVLVSKDAGTVMIIGIIIVGILFFVKFNRKKLITIFLFTFFGTIMLFLVSSTKRARLMAILNPNGCDPQGVCYQTKQASYGMANGGIFGSGIGGSKEKWLHLSEADNDFIFAIIGEELGLIGCVIVLTLFIFIALSLIKIVSFYSVSNATNTDSINNFESLFVLGIFLWFFGQSTINIAMVMRFFPVVGIPLPFVSSGGSSMMSSVLAICILFRLIPYSSKKHIFHKPQTK